MVSRRGFACGEIPAQSLFHLNVEIERVERLGDRDEKVEIMAPDKGGDGYSNHIAVFIQQRSPTVPAGYCNIRLYVATSLEASMGADNSPGQRRFERLQQRCAQRIDRIQDTRRIPPSQGKNEFSIDRRLDQSNISLSCNTDYVALNLYTIAKHDRYVFSVADNMGVYELPKITRASERPFFAAAKTRLRSSNFS